MHEIPSKCPIVGHYSGIIPDNEDLCALVTSDCQKPDIMYYQVGPCTDDVIYEKRTYRCVGQWIDDKGVLYSYTKRIDTIPSYECFVGAETSLGTKKIFIKEAGESCHKHINPFQLGMEMDQLSEFLILMNLSIGIDSIINNDSLFKFSSLFSFYRGVPKQQLSRQRCAANPKRSFNQIHYIFI